MGTRASGCPKHSSQRMPIPRGLEAMAETILAMTAARTATVLASSRGGGSPDHGQLTNNPTALSHAAAGIYGQEVETHRGPRPGAARGSGVQRRRGGLMEFARMRAASPGGRRGAWWAWKESWPPPLSGFRVGPWPQGTPPWRKPRGSRSCTTWWLGPRRRCRASGTPLFLRHLNLPKDPERIVVTTSQGRLVYRVGGRAGRLVCVLAAGGVLSPQRPGWSRGWRPPVTSLQTPIPAVA